MAKIKRGNSKHKKDNQLFLILDLQKAFDSVPKNKLFDCLHERCVNDKEKQLYNLIKSLSLKQKINIQDEIFEIERGVSQGSVLFPLLFNIYQEAALKSSKLLNKLMSSRDIVAYADDLLISSDNGHVIKAIIKEF